jgi:hypothetical protein
MRKETANAVYAVTAHRLWVCNADPVALAVVD